MKLQAAIPPGYELDMPLAEAELEANRPDGVVRIKPRRRYNPGPPGSPWWRSFRGPGPRRRPLQPGTGLEGGIDQWVQDDAKLRRLERAGLWTLLAMVSTVIVALVLVVFGGDSALPPKPHHQPDATPAAPIPRPESAHPGGHSALPPRLETTP